MLFQALMNYTITFVYQWHSSSTIKKPNKSGARIGKSQDPRHLGRMYDIPEVPKYGKRKRIACFFEALSFGII